MLKNWSTFARDILVDIFHTVNWRSYLTPFLQQHPVNVRIVRALTPTLHCFAQQFAICLADTHVQFRPFVWPFAQHFY